jgi:hypothetical protein
MLRTGFSLLALCVFVTTAWAADAVVTRRVVEERSLIVHGAAPAPTAIHGATVVDAETGRLIADPGLMHPPAAIPEPIVRFGCKRIWRCDSVVCDWRRACVGVYGYKEGPYYTEALARRHYERHGWAMPPVRRRTDIGVPILGK